jgi:membrane protease YdiL (CAAX protease family)
MGATWQRRLAVLLAGVGFEGGLGVLAWLLGWLFGQDPLGRGRWDAAAAGWGVLACLPMLAAFLLAHRSNHAPFVRIRRFLDDVLIPLLRGCSLAELALLAALAGLGEEMLFRGFLQDGVNLWWPTGTPWPGLLVASVAFGLLHPLSKTYVLFAALLGLYLGLVYEWSGGNLLVVAVAHGAYDFVLLAYLVRRATPAASGAAGPG